MTNEKRKIIVSGFKPDDVDCNTFYGEAVAVSIQRNDYFTPVFVDGYPTAGQYGVLPWDEDNDSISWRNIAREIWSGTMIQKLDKVKLKEGYEVTWDRRCLDKETPVDRVLTQLEWFAGDNAHAKKQLQKKFCLSTTKKNVKDTRLKVKTLKEAQSAFVLKKTREAIASLKVLEAKQAKINEEDKTDLRKFKNST